MIEEKRRCWTFPVCLIIAYEQELINAEELMLLGKINALCDVREGCFARNSYLAKWWNKSEVHVSRTISKFEELGFIEISREERKRTIRVTFQGDQTLTKMLNHVNKNVKTGSTKMLTHYSNTIGVERSEQAAGAATRVSTFGLNGESSITKLCHAFASFTIKHRLHEGNQGATKDSWEKRTLRRWERPLEDLIEQVGNIKEVQRVMEWYFAHYGDEYIPTAQTMNAFCRKWGKFKSAMARHSNGHSRHGEPESPRRVSTLRVNGKLVEAED